MASLCSEAPVLLVGDPPNCGSGGSPAGRSGLRLDLFVLISVLLSRLPTGVNEAFAMMRRARPKMVSGDASTSPNSIPSSSSNTRPGTNPE